MPKVCQVKDVPVGGVYRQYNPERKEPNGPELTVLCTGVRNGIGYSDSVVAGGGKVRDWHFQHRPPVLWLNDVAILLTQDQI
jgi:hypothetical protein